ncbi:MAG: STM4012 family radical SAM protein [Myxococcaceae bacterium]|nr:STM4012 family radical SAM protein [Myxococcaceae bacterium]
MSSALDGSPYQGYLYGYPHKTAYRALEVPVPLGQVWRDEPRDALFLYVHVPFCAMRCGFCNLFTAAGPVEAVVARYLDALEREAKALRAEVGRLRFVRAAVGGGTPTFLSEGQLSRVLDLMQLEPGVPLSVELSPETTTPEKVALLARRGATRLSIGVQSFVPAELAQLKRPQELPDVERALDAMRAHTRCLNLDLIYGIEGQTEATFVSSIRAALRWAPDELYLYPLYVRPLTLLGRGGRSWDDERLALYRAGRAYLLANGYAQVSMRMFRKNGAATAPAPAYRCQEDGMVGLGCGARSYTRSLHYSNEFAVASREVRGIIEAYSARDADSFRFASYGYRLGDEDRLRRRVILSLLSDDGLTLDVADARELPQLAELEDRGLAARAGERLVLTPAGLERSDAIGPWLQSEAVTAAMKGWQLR